MKRMLNRFSCLFVCLSLRLVADDSIRGGLEDFTTPILRLSAAVPTVQAASTSKASAETAQISGLAIGRPMPRMSLEPAIPLFGSELSVSGPSVRYLSSPTLVRQTERLRADWAAQDARRLERVRLQDGAWNRAVNTVFPEPEVFRLGHTEMSGGLINAIKRRNPFCLLNPVFFSFSF